MTHHDILTVNVTQAVADFYPGLSDLHVEYVAEKIVSGQSEIYEVYRKSSYEDLKLALEEWLGEGSEETSESTAQPVAAAAKSNDNIDKAFDDLFNQ